jgi:hypothetical protein
MHSQAICLKALCTLVSFFSFGGRAFNIVGGLEQ